MNMDSAEERRESETVSNEKKIKREKIKERKISLVCERERERNR